MQNVKLELTPAVNPMLGHVGTANIHSLKLAKYFMETDVKAARSLLLLSWYICMYYA